MTLSWTLLVCSPLNFNEKIWHFPFLVTSLQIILPLILFYTQQLFRDLVITRFHCTYTQRNIFSKVTLLLYTWLLDSGFIFILSYKCIKNFWKPEHVLFTSTLKATSHNKNCCWACPKCLITHGTFYRVILFCVMQ